MNGSIKSFFKGILLFGTGVGVTVAYTLFGFGQSEEVVPVTLATDDLCPASETDLEISDTKSSTDSEIYFVNCGGFF